MPFGFWFLGHENPMSGGSGHILKHRSVRSVPINDIIETLSDDTLRKEIMNELQRTVNESLQKFKFFYD